MLNIFYESNLSTPLELIFLNYYWFSLTEKPKIDRIQDKRKGGWQAWPMSVLFAAPQHFFIVRSDNAVLRDKVEHWKLIFVALKYY